MFKTLSYFTLLLLSFTCRAQQRWAFLKGNAYDLPSGIYGTIGVSNVRNNLGGRQYAATWAYNHKLYVFGGWGADTYNSVGRLNDLWVFDSSTNNWTYLKGSTTYEAAGSWGTMGVASPSNVPSARRKCAFWVYDNKFYLMGGDGNDAGFVGGELSDLWVYDPATNNWTWLSGSSRAMDAGSYGTMGVESATNRPPARYGAVSWTYNNKLYLFGGSSYRNDLWVYNPISGYWTWLKGDNFTGGSGSYGTLGVTAPSNLPRPRVNANGWLLNGKFYLFGGEMDLADAYLNDLWRYDPISNNWTWLKGSSSYNDTGSYGTQYITTTASRPAAREGCATWMSNGKLFLLGGMGYNDLWVFDTASRNWTWISGDKGLQRPGRYSTQGSFLSYNHPSGRDGILCWEMNNHAYIFGGRGRTIADSDVLSCDLWDYHPSANTWGWVKGFENPSCASYSSSTSISSFHNNPYARTGNVTWQLHDTIYVYSGNLDGAGGSVYDDLWRYIIATNQWVRLRGTDTLNQNVIYGTMGIASPGNTPGARLYGAGWTFNNKFYLFGGGDGSPRYNDVWEYNPATNQWRWLRGTNSSVRGTYGTIGVTAPTNTPGARRDAVRYAYNNKFYVFGGYGRDASGSMGELNDLWQYDPLTNNWTWLKGSNTMRAVGTYGTIGVASGSNNPGARRASIGWVCNNKFYLHGGWGWVYSGSSADGRLCDLWEYDPATNNWRWLKGMNYIYDHGVYGTMGTPSSGNFPGPRMNQNAWTYNNKLYLLGGSGYGWDWSASGGDLNDMWIYDPATNLWGWFSGSNSPGQLSNYAVEGVASAGNVVGGRSGASTWSNNGMLYLWAGNGRAVNSSFGYMRNDIWSYEACTTISACYPTSPTINFLDSIACSGMAVELRAGNPGSRYLWSTGDTSEIIEAAATGTYWLRVTNPAGLVSRDTVSVRIVTNPIVSLGNDTSICAGRSLTLDAMNPGAHHLWSTSDTTRLLSVSTAGIYSVLVTDAYGCHSNDEISVSVNANPIVSIGNDTAVCAGASILLDAGNPGSSYLWNTAATTETISVSTAGSYFARVTDTNGCVASDTIRINFHSNPVVNLGRDTNLCNGSTLVLNAGNPGSTYLWNTSAVTETITLSTSGIYNVIVTDTNGCRGKDTIAVTFHSNPIVHLGADTTICAGSTIVLGSATAGSTYLWNTGATTPTLSVTDSGTYSVVVTNAFGCTGADTIYIASCASTDVWSSTLSKLTIFPNPASSIITIRNSSPITKVIIYNSLGSIMHEANMNKTECNVSIGNYPSGLYFVRVIIQEVEIEKKIIVVR